MSMPQIIAEPGSGSNPRAHWPKDLQKEFEDNYHNGIVGSVLVSETDTVRVWHLQLPPGKRCTFHRHVLDYFWTCHSHGKARGWYEDGRIQDVLHYPGDTMHFRFGKGEGFTHSVQNIGETELLFTTVEYKNSENAPLEVANDVRLKHPNWM